MKSKISTSPEKPYFTPNRIELEISKEENPMLITDENLLSSNLTNHNPLEEMNSLEKFQNSFESQPKKSEMKF